MNYDDMPKQIKCRICKTVQDADHKYCKECGVSFRSEVFQAPSLDMDTRMKDDLDAWIKSEKKYFIPPVCGTATKLPMEYRATMLCGKGNHEPELSTMLSTPLEIQHKMTKDMYASCDCGCSSHIADALKNVTVEDFFKPAH